MFVLSIDERHLAEVLSGAQYRYLLVVDGQRDRPLQHQIQRFVVVVGGDDDVLGRHINPVGHIGDLVKLVRCQVVKIRRLPQQLHNLRIIRNFFRGRLAASRCRLFGIDGLEAVDDNHRNIVLSTRCIGQFDAFLGRRLRLTAAHHTADLLFISQVLTEAVTAHQQPVIGVDVDHECVDVHRFAHADGPSHGILMLKFLFRRPRSDLALADHFIEQRVIIGNLLYRSIAKSIHPGVADVADETAPSRQHQCHTGRAHAPPTRILSGHLKNTGIPGLDGPPHHRRQLVGRRRILRMIAHTGQ